MSAPRSSSSVLADTARAQRRVRPLVALAIASLLVGLWAGLARIGWVLPAADGDLMMRHGGLMVVGFVSTVVSAERAVAVRSLPAFAAPILSAAAGLSLIFALPATVAPALAIAAAVAYIVNMSALMVQHRAVPAVLQFIGSICLLLAAMLWAHGDGFRVVVPWWIVFLALTIGAERLELLRFQRSGPFSTALGLAALVATLGGAAIGLWQLPIGSRMLGVGLVIAAGWLLSRDNARRTVRGDGLARFMAVGLLSAYGWLAVTGLLLAGWSVLPPGLLYDAVIHAFFIGVVISSIIAHEPIIAPSVGGIGFRYSPLLYAPLALLDGALVLRIAGDVLSNVEARRWGGMVQAIAIVLLLAVSARSVLLARGDAGAGGARRA